VALFFAVNNDPSLDGAVYVSSSFETIDYDRAPNPFEIAQDYMLLPPHVSPRIAAQAARFTISKNPLKPLPLGEKSEKLIIKSKAKDAISTFLTIQYNIGPATLFPGLDGVCKQIAEETYKSEKLISPILRIASLINPMRTNKTGNLPLDGDTS
jgi:hypothetical protein